MNEKSKLIIVLSVIAAIILLVVGTYIADEMKSKKVYEQFEEVYNKNENTLVYIGKTTCGYCNLLTPSLNDMKERYNFEYLSIDVNTINSKYLTKILNMVDVKSINDLGTPYLAIVSNGKMVDKQPGYVDYDKLFEFLQKNSVISKDEKLLLNYIGIEEYSKLIKQDEASIIVVGQSTCSYCVKAKLLLNNIAESKKTKINYLNLSYLLTDEAKKTFTSSFDYFKTDSWGTPVTIIVKDGKIIDKLEQMVTEEEYIKFFEKNGVL